MPKSNGFVKVPDEYIQQNANNPEKIGAYVIAKQMEFRSPDGVVSPKEFGYRVGWNRSRSFKYLSGIRVLTSRKQLGNNWETSNPPPGPISGESGNQMETKWKQRGSGDLILPLKTKTKTTPLPPLKDNPKVEYPEWLNVNLWNQFLENRKKLRKPMTDNAQIIAINKLSKLISAGEVQNELLEAAIVGGWQGLFAVRDKSLNDPATLQLKLAGSQPSTKYREI